MTKSDVVTEDLKYNIVDGFNVTFNNGLEFFCEKRETIQDEDDKRFDGWNIHWKKGDGMTGTINLFGKHARTSVFQIIDSFKIQ